MREKLRAARIVARYAYGADRAGSVVASAVTCATILLGVFVPVVFKVLTDAVLHHDRRGTEAALLLLVTVSAALLVAYWVSLSLRMTVRERTTLYFDTKMAEMAASIHHIEHYERPDYLDELFILQHNHQQLADVQNNLINSLSVVIRLLLTVILLAGIQPLLLLLPLTGIPSVLANLSVARHRHQNENQIAPQRRLVLRLFQIGASAEAGKEMRVYDTGDDLLARSDAARAVIHDLADRESLRAGLLGGLGWLCFGLGFVAAMLLVARQAAAGHASPGDVVLALTLAGGVNAGVVSVANSVSWLLDNLKLGERLGWLEDLAADAATRSTPADPLVVPPRLEEGIRFEAVSFRYPGTPGEVLRDVELFVPSGSTLAIVGDNGAGKTTLVKLLCRFYDPTSGRVTVDGVDLRSFPVAAWRDRLSGCFQDFARPELVAGETVGIGDLALLGDAGAIDAALERAHAGDVSATLPDGLASQLGRSFDGGVEPSTGQWQKLALGRAMMREFPLLLVLDEPTASLDAATEHALFARYAAAAADSAARSGAITVLVSHRFSTVRMADLIVVLAEGRVAEVGSHASLLAAGGGYAELYELQARAYR
ncbi:MAG: ATP-binding cassette domain-containing protein [Acidimicrobiales bacterium]